MYINKTKRQAYYVAYQWHLLPAPLLGQPELLAILNKHINDVGIFLKFPQSGCFKAVNRTVVSQSV